MPKTAPRKLQDTQAQKAQNVRLWSGDVRSIRSPLSVEALGSTGLPLSIYRLGTTWLRWLVDVDVARNPVYAPDEPERIYYTGHHDPKATDATLAVTGGGDQYPLDYYRLGVVAPNTAPTVGSTGGTGADTTRSYLYTYVTEWGEEGPPSPAGEGTHPEDATWNITGMDVAPPNALTISDVDNLTTYVEVQFTVEHFLEDHETVTISGVVGMTDLNATWRVRTLYKALATADSYADTNQSSTRALNNTVTGVAQSFTGNGQRLTRVRLDLSKTGSPTGNAVAKLYAHTGTYGTSSTPTGAALATSNNFDVSTLTTTLTVTEIEFPVGEWPTLTQGTNYVIAIEYTGTVTDYVNVGTDNTAPTHAGNLSTLSGTWSAVAGEDAVFYVMTEGILDAVKIVLATAQPYTSGGTALREAEQNTTDMIKRIYRTNADGDFVFVDQVPVSTTSYDDTKTDDQLGTLALPIEDFATISPPRQMHGIIALPNGIMCGFVGNQICLSDPYKPYAYPQAYRFTVDFDVVGLGAFGNTLVICTTGQPYLATGVHPEVFTSNKLDYRASCVSKQGIVSLLTGVMYPGPNGYIYVGTGGPRNATEGLLDKRLWDLYDPTGIVAEMYDNRLVAFFKSGGPLGNECGGFIFDPVEPTALWQELNLDMCGLWLDEQSGDLFTVFENVVYQWDAAPFDMSGFWKSKDFKTPRPVVITCAKVRATFLSEFIEGDQESAIVDRLQVVTDQIANGEINDNGCFGGFTPAKYTVAGGPYINATFGLEQTAGLIFRLFANGDVVHQTNITNEEPFRIRMDDKRDIYNVELSGHQVQVHEVLLGTSMSDLSLA